MLLLRSTTRAVLNSLLVHNKTGCTRRGIYVLNTALDRVIRTDTVQCIVEHLTQSSQEKDKEINLNFNNFVTSKDNRHDFAQH